MDTRSTHLFVDDTTIGSMHGVVRTLHPAQKSADPVVVPDRPWEGRRVYTYGTVHYAPESELFKMWYMCRPSIGPRERAPTLRFGARDLVLYATSDDGIHWEKPGLGMHEFDGSRENNIVFDLHSPSVIVDQSDGDPEQRYKMLGVGGPERNYWAAHSADGLTWTDYPVNPVIAGSDTVTTVRDPSTGDYLAFHKRRAPVRGHERRVVWLATSPDFQSWSESRLILVPDEEDDAWVQPTEQRTEFYVMSGFPYGGGFLGLLSVFRLESVTERTGPEQGPHDGPIEAQLTHSGDGREWKRFEDRSPIIPVGETGSFDSGCILGASNPPVIYDDQVWVYYTAINVTHAGPMPPKRITIGRACWRLDGFVSLDAGPAGGVVETVPLAFSGERLEVNADASQGSLAVEVLSAAGDPLRGYGRQHSRAIESDSVRHAVSWEAGDRLPAGNPVRLRFHLRDAQLYSFRPPPPSEQDHAALGQPGRRLRPVS